MYDCFDALLIVQCLSSSFQNAAYSFEYYILQY